MLIGSLLVAITLQNFIATYWGWQNIYFDIFLFVTPFLVYYPLRFSVDYRRFHDFNASGFCSILHFLPRVSFLVTLFLTFKNKKDDNNQYGQGKDVFSFSYLFRGNYAEGDSKKSEKGVYRILGLLVVLFVFSTVIESLPFPKHEYASSEEKASLDAKEEGLIASILLRAF